MVDVLTCYAVTGFSALLGLGLMWLIRTDQPRVLYALNLFRAGFIALSGMGVVVLASPLHAPILIKAAIGLAGVGITLLGWAFRQLNGRRTPPWVGTAAMGTVGLALGAAALLPPEAYVQAVAGVFFTLSCALTLDQALLIRAGRHWVPQDLALLAVATLLSLIWTLVLYHALSAPGPLPPDWLHAPDWLRPIAALSFAVLPLGVAALVFASINDRLQQQLRARSLSDDLTGALSRRGLRELGERMLALQRGQTRTVAVLMLDIDHFRALNERYGQQIGDQVLRHLTQVVRESLREDALLARYGGEEFTVLLPVRMLREAEAVAERLRKVIERSPCESKIGPVRATVSIGLSLHEPDTTLEDDLALADEALSTAKASGRNRVQVAERTSRLDSRHSSRFDSAQPTLPPGA